MLRSSLRGALYLGNVEPWGPEPEPSPSAQYDLSGARAALLLAVTQGRPGAQHDVEALGGLCQALGFKTALRTDPAAQAFQEEMAQFRKWLDAHRGPVSCALVALMAHGGPQGQLLGADGQEGQLEALVQELSCCGALQGRPKIFLLQACRGGHRDAGVGPAALPWFRRWLRAPPATPSQADVLHVCTDVQGNSSRGPTPESPNQADVLMVYAATEGCVAYRDEKGSDFIQTLVEVLRADPKADLLELMTEHRKLGWHGINVEIAGHVNSARTQGTRTISEMMYGAPGTSAAGPTEGRRGTSGTKKPPRGLGGAG
nr:caspase-14-like isoform X2 [Odocoileus virginianus texanus]